MSDTEVYFLNNKARYITKWNHYFDIYEKHFSPFRGKDIVVLEIGIYHGGSLQMWKSYFGPQAKIFGVDINPDCSKFEESGIHIFIGSQEDKKFLAELKTKIPPIDILIDDGGHSMKQQIITFNALFDHVKPDGIYLCEDTHTSYWIEYGGGFRRPRTFIEFSKKLIDQLNGFHSEQKALQPNSITKSVNSITFYDSIVVMEKKARSQPYQVSSGSLSFNTDSTQKSWRHFVLLWSNKVLRFLGIGSWRW